VELGAEFMRMIEPMAAYVPYMTCPGNHGIDRCHARAPLTLKHCTN
jgi:hypothetical protein